MNCPQCNAQVPGDAKFCPVCGTAVTAASPAPAPGSQATESSAVASSYPADAGTTAPSKPSASSFDSSVAVEFLKKNKKAVIGAGAAVVVVLVAIVAFVMISSNVPEDVVKRDLMNTYLMEHGAVSSSYVNDSDYSITELKITGQSEEKLSSDLLSLATTAATGSNTVRRVSVSGKISNESFETSFTGYLYYVKANDQWVEINTDVDATSTKPLKGVDKTESTSSSSAQVSDFSSTLEESNGSYVSVATQKVKYSYWFADDTATSTSSFKFDQEKGWQRQGDAQLSDTKTEWKLSGKTFAYNEGSSFFSSGTKNSTVSFGDCSGETANATYTIGYTPSSNSSSYTEYLSVDLKGSASGSLTHEFSKESFKVELNDKGNSVTFSFSGHGSSTTTSAGVGEVNQLYGSFVTKAVYSRSTSGNNERTFEMSGYNFTEKTAA